MYRRTFVQVSLGTCIALTGCKAFAATEWDAWSELLNFLPEKSPLNAERTKRGTSEVDFRVQKIEEANSTKINFDYYAIDIQKLPSGTSAEALFLHVRKNLNNFFDQNYSEFKPYSDADKQDWSKDGKAQLGTIMQFDIPVWGAEEQAAVITSKSTDTSWVFTPVDIGSFAPGEHPVAGNRAFVLEKPAGLAARIYTRGADRALAGPLDPGEDTVYNGADGLWKSFQSKLAEYVNSKGGGASIGQRILKKPKWEDVKKSGLFDRA